MPLSLLSLWYTHPSSWMSHYLHAQKDFRHPSCLLVFKFWLLQNQEKEIKKRREEENQEKNQRVDQKSNLVQICREIILGEERSTSKRIDPDWSWVDTYRGQVLMQLKKIHPFLNLDSKKRLAKQICDLITYLISAWNQHVLILAYEIDPYVLYFYACML